MDQTTTEERLTAYFSRRRPGNLCARVSSMRLLVPGHEGQALITNPSQMVPITFPKLIAYRAVALCLEVDCTFHT